MPLKQRVPKLKGFNNPFRVEYSPVNLDQLEACGESTVDPDVLVAKGLVRKGDFVKVLARGEITIEGRRAPRTAFRRLPRLPSRLQAVASRCCRCPSSRVARRSRATSSPTVDPRHYR